MLITLPDYDITTYYLSAWSKRIIRVAKKNDLEPVILEGENATRSSVASNIGSKNPKFLAFNGHGSDKSIEGHNGETLIELGENHKLLKDRIVHSISCSSGRKLGKNCGAKAFIGYNDVFWLPMYRFSTASPLEDKLATPVMKSALEAPVQLAKRKDAKTAYEKSQETYKKWINEYTDSSSEYTTEELQIILPCLHWNMVVQSLEGDPKAKR